VSLLAASIILVPRILSHSSVRYPSVARVPDWLWPSPSKDSESLLPPLWIDDLDPLAVADVHESDYCTDRFSPRYLESLRDHSVQYCPSSGSSQFTCFHTHLRDQQSPDSLCIGQGAVLDVAKRAFRLDCEPRGMDVNESARGLVGVDDIQQTWFDTGPRYLIDNFVEFDIKPEPAVPPVDIKRDDDTPQFTLLLKREGNRNFWHSMMEIFSTTMTFDALRISRDPSNHNRPFFRFPQDVPNTQIVILDDQPNQPWFNLWRMFSGREPVRLKDILTDPARAQEFANQRRNIILPLAGGANPLWHNDWVVRDCRHAPLLRLFVRRVMAHAGLRFETGPRPTAEGDKKDIRLTFLKRRGSRKLLRDDALLDAIRLKYPGVEVTSVDMGNLPLPEQLRTIQETDLLLGVHGAGLTHMMFMREGAGAVVEIQPEGLLHKGFRNLAVMTGQKYFVAQAEIVSPEEEERQKQEGLEGNLKERAARREEKHWQSSAVQIDEARFLALVDAALKSLYNEGLRSHDAV